MSEYLPRPLSYRAKLLDKIMPLLQAGECCSLVGVSGVGKSNLVGFLRRKDVQASYWNTDSAWLVLIDTHSLMFGEQPTDYAILELIIHRLIMEIESRALSTEIASWASDLHARLVAQPSAHMAMRYLERLCARLCQTDGIQIIFVFDQFESLWQTTDARFFLNLRSLRDQFKYQIVYLVITRDPLQGSRADLQAVEAFWELFTSHVYGLGMYSPDDAQFALRRLATRRGSELPADLQQLALCSSGGHPGLLRALFWALCADPLPDPSEEGLLNVAAIADECAKIWHDLTPDEQRSVRMIALGQPARHADDAALDTLLLKEILIGSSPTLFSPLFHAFVARQGGLKASGVVVAPDLRQVWVDGLPVAKPLARLEFALLTYLARHAGTVCKREDIMRELYGEHLYNANDERLDTILRRLREALGEDARSPRYLITHRGAGVQLSRGSIQE